MLNVEIDVRRLEIRLRTHAGGMKSLRGIDLRINEGETLCLVGEFGSGRRHGALHHTAPACDRGHRVGRIKNFHKQGDVCSIKPALRPPALGQT
jgi:ABC-type dipeptide/oligopeptide/nickel transport system ATPase component